MGPDFGHGSHPRRSGRNPRSHGREFARAEAVGIEQNTTLTAAASLMINHDPAHLVVTDGGTPIGMVSTLDLAASLALGGE